MLHTMLATVAITWSAMLTESVLILVSGMEKYQSANVSERDCNRPEFDCVNVLQ